MVGLGILGKLGPCSGKLHRSVFLRLCSTDGTTGENEEEQRKMTEALAKLKDIG